MEYYGERSEIRDQNDYYPNYQLVGRSVAAGSPLRKCRSSRDRCRYVLFDSAYELNILQNAGCDVHRAGGAKRAGGALSGGNNSVRFFLSGDRNVEFGPWKLPTSTAGASKRTVR